jgi:chromosome segregation ATPase
MKRRSEILKEVYAHLRNHFGIHTQGQFADAIGYSRPVISSALNGNDDNVTDKMLRAVNNKFPGVFNIDYLLTGEGQLLTVEEDVTKKEIDTLLGRKPEKPDNNTEVPEAIQELLDRTIAVSKRNEALVESLAGTIQSLNTFSAQIESMRKENENLKASNTKLGQRLDKAAELFMRLNNQVATLLKDRSYTQSEHDIMKASEPNVSPYK